MPLAAGLTGQPVEKLSGDDASRVIEELKKGKGTETRIAPRKRLKGVERYVNLSHDADAPIALLPLSE